MSSLLALYTSLDDATLETVASKGVLRRAMTDAGAVVIDRLDAAEIVGSVEGATVRLDAKGLAKSRCTCPAPGICRHRVALVIALRSQGAAAPAPEVPTDWPVRLAEFDQAALASAIGKTALREAVKLHALAESVTVEAAAQSLKVTLRTAKETVEVSIPAAGEFGAIASALPPRRQAAWHGAAVLAARRHFGLAAEEVAAEAPEATDEFQPDGALLAAIAAALRAAYAQGFAVPSPAIEERLGLLAISGRAEALPRLAAALKRIAAGLEQRRLRAIAHDPAALLSELGYAHALVHAIEQARDAETRRGLAGAVRSDYAQAGDLDLIGLGAELFETATGARGVSAYFLERATGRRFSASLARGSTHDTGFDPRTAYAVETVWGRRFSQLAGASLRLAGAQASATGRLSLGQEIRVETLAPFVPTRELLEQWLDEAGGPVAGALYASWQRLADDLGDSFAPSLAAPPPAAVPVVLYPARIAPVAFDDLTQSLTWPLMDRAGKWLALSLDHDESGGGLSARRIAALEAALGDARAAKPFAIVALARPEGDALGLAPMALWGESQLLLDFPPRATAPERGLVAGLIARLRKAGDHFAPRPPPDRAGGKLKHLTAAALDALIETAETGTDLSARTRKLAPMAQAFDLASLQPVAALFRHAADSTPADAAAAALAAAWGVVTLQGLARRVTVWG